MGEVRFLAHVWRNIDIFDVMVAKYCCGPHNTQNLDDPRATGLIFVASVKIMASIDKLGYDDVVLVQDDVGIEKSLAVCFTQLLPHHQYICEIST